MGIGIDYGLGTTNIDRANGIRYGVIPMNALSEWAHESFEADYGEPSCPKCGNEAEDDLDTITDREGLEEHDFEPLRERGCTADYYCVSCRVYIPSDDAFGEEPCGWDCTEDGYTAHQSHDDSDVFITKSPYYTRAAFCSPCAPGACHLESPHDDGEKTYCFGPDWFDKESPCPYPVYRVDNNELIYSPPSDL